MKKIRIIAMLLLLTLLLTGCPNTFKEPWARAYADGYFGQNEQHTLYYYNAMLKETTDVKQKRRLTDDLQLQLLYNKSLKMIAKQYTNKK